MTLGDPVPEELWIKVAEYCDNDVLATEAVFNHLKADFTAREILADVAGMTVKTVLSLACKRQIAVSGDCQILFSKNRGSEPITVGKCDPVVPDQIQCQGVLGGNRLSIESCHSK